MLGSGSFGSVKASPPPVSEQLQINDFALLAAAASPRLRRVILDPR
jgi:hypothetical protein